MPTKAGAGAAATPSVHYATYEFKDMATLQNARILRFQGRRGLLSRLLRSKFDSSAVARQGATAGVGGY
jgi:hypothetical protein